MCLEEICVTSQYMVRQDGLFCKGHYAVLNGFCYTEILRYYYLAPHPKEHA